MIRTYTDLLRLSSFEERFRYLQLGAAVGRETFGFDRWLNQVFYHNTPEWRTVRRDVIARDYGCDLAVRDREIYDEKIIVHHMNPITMVDIVNRTEFLLDPEYLITTTDSTHKAIHYGDESLLMLSKPVVRLPNDTCPWR